ncbi:t-SNARE, partial [Rhodotorula diobovata]
MPAAPSSPWHQPVTRSRTSLFLSYRDSASRPTPSTPFSRYSPYDDDDDDNDDNDDGLAGEEAGLIGRNSLRTPAIPQRGPAGDAAALPPRWVDEADHVDALVRAVKPKIAHLDKLHAKHLLPGFKDRSLEEREIQVLATSITSDFRSCQSHIRRIAEQSQQLLLRHPPRPGDAETRRIDLVMAANVQTALATKVQDLSALFRKNQAEYLRQLRGNESKAVELQNRAATVYDPLVALADDEQASRSALSSAPGPPGTPSLAQQQFFSPSPAAQSSSSSHQALDARTAEIASIAQSIADLADLFKDLSSLVIDQGTLLDRVDWNVEVLGREVGAAGDELVRATRHQRRSGKCQLIFLLVLLVLACLVVLLLRPPRFASNSTSPTT